MTEIAKEKLQGEVVETNSSDEAVAKRLQTARNQTGGLTGLVVDVPSADYLEPKPVVQGTPIATIHDQTKGVTLDRLNPQLHHTASMRGLQVWSIRTAKKKA